MYFTIQHLRDKGASEAQVAVCAWEWPDGAEVNADVLLRAVELGLGVGWLATTFLPEPLLKEYNRQKALLLEEYFRQNAPLLEECERQDALLRAEYERQSAPFWEEYYRQRTSLWKELERRSALLLATIIEGQPAA